ncbi:MAG: hypothetical protein E6J42_12145, partial [Chloroflexi bacterium]
MPSNAAGRIAATPTSATSSDEPPPRATATSDPNASDCCAASERKREASRCWKRRFRAIAGSGTKNQSSRKTWPCALSSIRSALSPAPAKSRLAGIRRGGRGGGSLMPRVYATPVLPCPSPRRSPMYDAIVVGARCAGSPTAMLLARSGYKVLLVDRDSFPSDIMSTHFIHLPGKARLQRWGLLDKVIATGAPPIERGTLHFNGMSFQPPPPPLPEGISPETICPRRIELDKILVDAAVEAGAEMRENFPVRDLLWEQERVIGVRGGPRDSEVEESARIVIGADGLHSTIARLVKPPEYDCLPSLTFGYYAYWS